MKHSSKCFILHLKQIRILGENWEESWVNLCKFFLTYPNSVAVLISRLFLSYELMCFKVRSHQRTQTGFGLRLAWDRTLGCVHTRLAWLWTSREYAMWGVSFISIFVLLVHTAVHLYSGRLLHHGNQSISSPKPVRLRSHLLESDLSFFPAHLD